MATPLPSNRASFDLAEMIAACGGDLARAGATRCTGVSTDSRTVTPGEAFVALVGERLDAHGHVAAAAHRGASVIVVSRDVTVPEGPAVLRVADTTRALGDLARAFTARWRAHDVSRRVVGITGSAGKTTTRRTTAAVLAELGRKVHATRGNLNNAVGIPMVLFGLEEHDAAVVEIGTSSPGEIAYGASLCDPDVALLTLVAAAHTEGLGTLDDVAEEKGALFAHLASASGKQTFAIANADDPRVMTQLGRARGASVVTFGRAEGATVRLRSRVPTASGADLEVEIAGATLAFHAPLLGIAGAMASVAALAAAVALGFSSRLTGELAARALGRVADDGDGRLTPRERADGTLVVDDSYNANGASMRASIETARELADARGARLVCVLGEMRELGPLSPSEHDHVGAHAAAARPARLFTVGGDASRIARVARAAGVTAEHVLDAHAAAPLVREAVRAGDVVLVKGSRGVGLEAVVAALIGGAA